MKFIAFALAAAVLLLPRGHATNSEDGCKARIYEFQTTQSRVSGRPLRVTAPHRISVDVEVRVVPTGSSATRTSVSFKVLVTRGRGDQVSPSFSDRNGLSLSFGRVDDDNDDNRDCSQTQVRIVLTIPDNMRFESHSFRLNGGKAECKNDITITALCAELTFRPWTAFGRVIEPVITKDTFTVTWLKGGVYVVREAGMGTYNSLIIVTTDGVIVVDAPPSIGGRNIDQAIRKLTSKRIKYFVYSHRHTDHNQDASFFGNMRGVTIVGQRAIKDALAGIRDPRRPVPHVTFDDEYTIRLGNETVELKHFGTSHDIGDTYVYSKRHGVVMLVDVVFPGMGPFRAFAETLDLDGYQKAHDILLGRTFSWRYFITGHFNVATVHDIEVSKRFSEDVERAAGRALQTTPLPDTGADVNGNVWLQFDSYLSLVEKNCADTVKDAYTGLSAVDVFAESHCSVMVKHLRLESAP